MILRANRAAVTLLGKSSKTLARKPIPVVADGESRRAIRKALGELSAGTSTTGLTVRLRAAGGGAIVAQGRLSAVRDQGGRLTEVRWIIRDVTQLARLQGELEGLNEELERRVRERTADLEHANQAKDELLRREQLARAAAEAAQRRVTLLAEASAILGRTYDFNASLPAVARLVVPELADWCIVDLVEEDGSIYRLAVCFADPTHESLARALPRRYAAEVAESYPLHHILDSGRPEFVSSAPAALLETLTRDREYVSFLRTAGVRSALFVPCVARGVSVGLITLLMVASRRRLGPDDVALAEDLAGRVAHNVDATRLYRQAYEANQAKANFLAVISHELRTPLNAIMGYADLMRLGIPDPLPAAARVQVERIDAASRHLLGLIEGVLDFARLEAGRESLHAEDVALPALVREATALVEPLATARGLSVEWSVAPDVPKLRSDPAKLRQILLNLAGNAVKYTDQGHVRIEVSHECDQVLLRVHDTGVGIAVRHLDRIFEPFWRAEELPKRRGNGPGLGLSVVRRLVTLLGGDVDVHSVVGKGSTFVVRLPLSLALPRQGHASPG
jgi:PAS domain S-box-containing protein